MAPRAQGPECLWIDRSWEPFRLQREMGLVSSCWSCLPFPSAFVLSPFAAPIYLCLNTSCVAASAEWLESRRRHGFCLVFPCKAWAPGRRCNCGCRNIWLIQLGHVSAFSSPHSARLPPDPPLFLLVTSAVASGTQTSFFFFPNCISAEGSHAQRGDRRRVAWQSLAKWLQLPHRTLIKREIKRFILRTNTPYPSEWVPLLFVFFSSSLRYKIDTVKSV